MPLIDVWNYLQTHFSWQELAFAFCEIASMLYISMHSVSYGEKTRPLWFFWQIQATNNGIRIIMKSKCVSKMQMRWTPHFFFLARTNCPFCVSSLKYNLSLQTNLSATLKITSNGADYTSDRGCHFKVDFNLLCKFYSLQLHTFWVLPCPISAFGYDATLYTPQQSDNEILFEFLFLLLHNYFLKKLN